jgi:rRNA processing protein Krr1/Pno1
MSTPVLHTIHFETRGHHVVSIACAQSHVGRIIGKHGITVSGIQLFANVTIGIDQAQEPASVLIVGGSAGAVALATSIVLDVILGNFKGFALLREMVNSYRASGEICGLDVFYQPGVGLFPSRQVVPFLHATCRGFLKG